MSPWLQKYASSFGFIVPYEKGNDYGYEYEDWHYVYEPLLLEYKQAYFEMMTDEVLDSLNGNNVASQENVLVKYILGKYYVKILEKRAIRKKLLQQKRHLQYLIFKNKQQEY